MELTLVTPEKKIHMGTRIKEIFVPGYEGELNILEGHAAFITTLNTGILRLVTEKDTTESYAISWGYCEVSDDNVKILAETAEGSKEIDTTRAEEAYKKAQMRLEDAGLSVSEYDKHMRKIERANLRLELAKQSR